MTPQPNLQLHDVPLASGHLTDDQMSELIASGMSTDAVEAHLDTCAVCAAEFASLREALSLFQEASVACADREFGRMRTPERLLSPMLPAKRPYAQTLVWLAASALLIAGILPIERRWQRSAPVAPAAAAVSSPAPESDEALLEDINQDLSRSVPASMQALDSPTGASTSQTAIQTSPQTSTQAKD